MPSGPSNALAIAVLGSLALAGCWTGHATPPTIETHDEKPPRRTRTKPIDIELRVDPTSVSMANLAKLGTSYTVTNTSTETLDPQLDHAELLINGSASVNWGNTNGNGAREPEWYKLPPGATLHRDYDEIGDTILFEPGDYTLQIRASGILSSAVHVHVSP